MNGQRRTEHMERQLKRFGNEENRHRAMSDVNVKFAEGLIVKWLSENGMECKVRCVCEEADTWFMRCEVEGDAVFYDRVAELIREWVYKHENGDPPMFLPLNAGKRVWVWKFYHPECPDQFLVLTEKMERGEVKGVDLHAFAEDAEEEERKFIVPTPKEGGNCAFLVLKKEFYDLIERGIKTAEYRDYNEYYVNKLLSHKIKYVKLNLGYKSSVSMTYAIAEIDYIGDDLETTISCYKGDGELRTEKEMGGMIPRYFKIVLGKRVR